MSSSDITPEHLDALPAGTVVLDRAGASWRLHRTMGFLGREYIRWMRLPVPERGVGVAITTSAALLDMHGVVGVAS